MTDNIDHLTPEDIDRIIEEIRLDFDAEHSALTTDPAYVPWARNAPWNWVTPNIAVGGDDYLGDQDLCDRMAAEGVTHVLDCRAEANRDLEWFPHSQHELVIAAKQRFVYLLNGTGDDGKPKSPAYFRKSIEFGLDALADPDAKIYVHCAAGYNRGPSSAFAILRAQGWTDKQAADAIHNVRCVGLLYQNDANRAIRALGYGPPKNRKNRRRSR